MTAKAKSKVITKPYVALDGRYGAFEERFEEWYLGQSARTDKMKSMLSVAFTMLEKNPMMFAMLAASCRDEAIPLEEFNTIIATATAFNSASGVEVVVKKPAVMRELVAAEARPLVEEAPVIARPKLALNPAQGMADED